MIALCTIDEPLRGAEGASTVPLSHLAHCSTESPTAPEAPRSSSVIMNMDWENLYGTEDSQDAHDTGNQNLCAAGPSTLRRFGAGSVHIYHMAFISILMALLLFSNRSWNLCIRPELVSCHSISKAQIQYKISCTPPLQLIAFSFFVMLYKFCHLISP